MWGSELRPENICWTGADKRLKAVCFESAAFIVGHDIFFADHGFEPSAYTPPETAALLRRFWAVDQVSSDVRDSILAPSIAGDYWALGLILLEIERGTPLFNASNSSGVLTNYELIDRLSDHERLGHLISDVVASVSSAQLREILGQLLALPPAQRMMGNSLRALLERGCFDALPRGSAQAADLTQPEAGPDTTSSLRRRSFRRVLNVLGLGRPRRVLPELQHEGVVGGVERARSSTLAAKLDELERGTMRCPDPAAPASEQKASLEQSMDQCPGRQNGQGVASTTRLQDTENIQSPVECAVSAGGVGDQVELTLNSSGPPTNSAQVADIFLHSSVFKLLKIFIMVVVFLNSFAYWFTKETISMVPPSACAKCVYCKPRYILDSLVLSDVKHVEAVASPSWASGAKFSQRIAFEGSFTVAGVSQLDKIDLTSEPSGLRVHTEGVIFPFQGLVQALDKLVLRPSMFRAAPSASASVDTWQDLWPTGEAGETGVVFASNDSFLGLQLVGSPLKHGGTPLAYAAIANTRTLELALPGPAPEYQSRFRLSCTASGEFSAKYENLPVSTYPFPGEIPSVTRVTASIKWFNSTLTAACVATIRDGPELQFFTATSAAAASTSYECATRMSFYAAFATAISHAGAVAGVLISGVPLAFKYAPKGFVAALLSVATRRRGKEPNVRSISWPLRLIWFVGLIVAAVLSLTSSGLIGIGMQRSEPPLDGCRCSFGSCTPGNDSVCRTCIDGYEKLSDEGPCVPIPCACENGLCDPGSPGTCAACLGAFSLTPDLKCERSHCDCSDGYCSETTSYCTGCYPGYALRSTGRPVMDTARGGYFFTTPICIKESFVNDTSRNSGGFNFV